MDHFERTESDDNTSMEPTSTEDVSVSLEPTQTEEVGTQASFATRDQSFNKLMKDITGVEQTPIEESSTTNLANEAFDKLMHSVTKETVEIPATATVTDSTATEETVERKQDTPIVYRKYVPPFEDKTRSENWLEEETARIIAENKIKQGLTTSEVKPEDVAWADKVLKENSASKQVDTSEIKNFVDPNQDDSEKLSPANPIDIAAILREESSDSAHAEDVVSTLRAGLEEQQQKEIKEKEDALKDNQIRQEELNGFMNDNQQGGYDYTVFGPHDIQTAPDRSQFAGEGDNTEKNPPTKRKRGKKAEVDNSNGTNPAVIPPVVDTSDSDTNKGPAYIPYVFPVFDPTTPVIRNTTPGTVSMEDPDREFENLVNSTNTISETNPEDIDFENLVAGTSSATEQNATTTAVERESERNARIREIIREEMAPINALAEQITNAVRELEPQIINIRNSLGQVVPPTATEPLPTNPDAETREQQETRILERVSQIIEQRIRSIPDLSVQVTDLQRTVNEINTRLQTLNTPATATTTATNATPTQTVPAATPTPTVAPTPANTTAAPAAGTTEPTNPTPNVPGAATATVETAQNQRMAQLENEIRTLRGQNTPEQKVVVLKTQMETLLNGRNPSELSVLEKSQYLDLLLARQQAIKDVNDAEKESTEKRKKKERIIALVAGIAGTGLAMVTPVVSVAAVVAVTLGGRIAAPLIKKGGEKLREKATAMKSADRNGQSLEQLKSVDEKIKRNEWWANRLGEFAAVVSGGTTGYGVGKLFQGLLLAAGNITTSTSVNAAIKAQNNLANEEMGRQISAMMANGT